MDIRQIYIPASTGCQKIRSADGIAYPHSAVVNDNAIKVKVKSTMLHKRAWVDAYLPRQGLEPVRGEPLMSVTRVQCDARLIPSQPQGITAHWLVPNYTSW